MFRTSDSETKRRLLRYFEWIELCKEINDSIDSKKIKRNISIIQDDDSNKYRCDYILEIIIGKCADR